MVFTGRSFSLTWRSHIGPGSVLLSRTKGLFEGFRKARLEEAGLSHSLALAEYTNQETSAQDDDRRS